MQRFSRGRITFFRGKPGCFPQNSLAAFPVPPPPDPKLSGRNIPVRAALRGFLPAVAEPKQDRRVPDDLMAGRPVGDRCGPASSAAPAIAPKRDEELPLEIRITVASFGGPPRRAVSRSGFPGLLRHNQLTADQNNQASQCLWGRDLRGFIG